MTVRVLVVEDEPDIRDLVTYSLSGCEVRAVPGGAEALQSVAEAQPDVVAPDIMMPGSPGLEVLERWRADPATAQLPVLVLTAKAHEGERAYGYELGADDYVTKPFDPSDLAQRVRDVAERRSPG